MTFVSTKKPSRPPRVDETRTDERPGPWIIPAVMAPLISMAIDFVRLLLGHPPLIELRPLCYLLFGIAWALSFGKLEPTRERILASSFELALAATYLTAWCAPGLMGETLFVYLAWLVPVELVAMICALGTAVLLRTETFLDHVKAGAAVVSFVACSIFLSHQVGHWWPFAAVALLGANRALSSLWQPDGGQGGEDSLDFFVFLRCGLLAMLALYLTDFEIPRYGWTDLRLPFVETKLQAFPLDGASPHKMLALGFLYFFPSGLQRLTRPRRLPSFGSGSTSQPPDPDRRMKSRSRT